MTLRTLPKLVSVVLLSLSQFTYGWGDQGHKAIWDVAQRHLTPQVKARVAAILAGDKLAMTAIWLDKARSANRDPATGPLKDDAEAKSFNTKFSHNDLWHFVNLPVGAHSYAESNGFTGPDDVVQRIKFCIAVLEGKEPAMSERTALRALIHLVGDIHQPLHCVTGYFDTSNLEHPILEEGTAAAAPFKEFEDRGGNQLFFGPAKFDELHGFWDADLVKDVIGGSGSFRELADHLDEMLATTNSSTSGNDHHEWAQHWADESLKLGTQAYRNISFGHTELNAEDNPKGRIHSIGIVRPDGYEETETDVVESQLAKAAERLAALLNIVLRPHN
jgi:hypothetical protein